jgi:hypothetical protein
MSCPDLSSVSSGSEKPKKPLNKLKETEFTMNQDELKPLVQEIVKQANELKNKHTNQTNAKVNYACIFSQNQEEYEIFIRVAKELGEVIKDTKSGPLFQIKPLETVSGKLQLLKIRNPDPTRPERGDADFTIINFQAFEKEYLPKEGFKLMQKENFYMIELIDKEFNVRVYFSNPPLDKQLRLV